MNDAGLQRSDEDRECPAPELDVTLVLLAGGQGSRMGKRKDQVRIGGHGLVQWMLGQVAWRGPTMLVGPSDHSRVEGEERVHRIVHDFVGGEGPLRGIEAAIPWCDTDAMVVVPIDMPGLGPRHVEWVARRGKAMPRASCVMLRRNADSGAQIEPFPLFCRKNFLSLASRRLSDGNRSMRTLVHEKDVRVVDAPMEWEDWVWSNLNDEADVVRFEKGFAQRGCAIRQLLLQRAPSTSRSREEDTQWNDTSCG